MIFHLFDEASHVTSFLVIMILFIPPHLHSAVRDLKSQNICSTKAVELIHLVDGTTIFHLRDIQQLAG